MFGSEINEILKFVFSNAVLFLGTVWLKVRFVENDISQKGKFSRFRGTHHRIPRKMLV